MTTAGPGIVARRQHREADRDANSNLDVPPGTGENSRVAPGRLIQVAQGYPATARPALSGDLAANVRAASVPRTGPGQTRSSGTGAAPRTGPAPRSTGKDGPGHTL